MDQFSKIWGIETRTEPKKFNKWDQSHIIKYTSCYFYQSNNYIIILFKKNYNIIGQSL